MVSQVSLSCGVPGIDVGEASRLEDKMGTRGLPGGHQGDGIAVIYGEKGSVRDVWGKKEVYTYLGNYAAGVLDNVRKTKKSVGMFFFTPLFLLVLSMWAKRKQWLNQLKAYRTKPAAMDRAIAYIFSDRFIKLLKDDGWCVCSCLLCSYYLWRRTNSNIYTHFFTPPIYTLGNSMGTRPTSCSVSTPPWRSTASGALLKANSTKTSSLARWWRTWRLWWVMACRPRASPSKTT